MNAGLNRRFHESLNLEKRQVTFQALPRIDAEHAGPQTTIRAELKTVINRNEHKEELILPAVIAA
jgi:hypothetical protein